MTSNKIPDLGFPGAVHIPYGTPQKREPASSWLEHYCFKPTPDVLVMIHSAEHGKPIFFGTVMKWDRPISDDVVDQVDGVVGKYSENHSIESEDFLVVMFHVWDKVRALTAHPLPMEVPCKETT